VSVFENHKVLRETNATRRAAELRLAVVITSADDPARLVQAARSAWSSCRAPERVTWWLVTTSQWVETLERDQATQFEGMGPAKVHLLVVSSDAVELQRADAVWQVDADWVIFTEAGCRHPVGWVEDWIEAIQRAETLGIESVGGTVEPAEEVLRDRLTLAVWLHEYSHALADSLTSRRPAGCDAAVAVTWARRLAAERGRLFDHEWTRPGRAEARRRGSPVRYARPIPPGGWISERIRAGQSYGQTRPIAQWAGKFSWCAALALTPLIAAAQIRGLLGSIQTSARGRGLARRAGIALVRVVLGWSWGEACGRLGRATPRDEDSRPVPATSP
jgi:hypothetical protein